MNRLVHKLQHVDLWRLRRASKFIAAGAMVFDPDGKILLIKSRLRGTWEYPAGGSSGQESPVETCRREVAEEAGLDIADYRLVGVDYHARKRANGFLMFTFAAEVSAAVAQQVNIQRLEVTDYRWVTRDEATELIPPERRDRFVAQLAAYDSGQPVYLHAGQDPR